MHCSPQNEFNQLRDQLARDYPDRASLQFAYDEPLSHLIYAGCDMFIVPSMFEPCGLTQMISMRYGTVPVVRKTGGLNDTVFDVDHDEDRAASMGRRPCIVLRCGVVFQPTCAVSSANRSSTCSALGMLAGQQPQLHPTALLAPGQIHTHHAAQLAPGCLTLLSFVSYPAGMETNGFSFDGTDSGGMDYALNRGLSAWYNDRAWWHELQAKCMNADWSWTGPGLDYIELYYKAIKS